MLAELRKLCGLDGCVDKVSLEDVKDLPDTHEEWVEFQLAFQLIQCCGEYPIGRPVRVTITLSFSLIIKVK